MQVPVSPSVAPSNIPLQSPAANESAGSFGADVGKGLADVGNNLGSLGLQLKSTELQTQKFAAMRSFSAFQTASAQTLTDLQQNAPVGQSNFTDQAVATYKNMGADFLNKLGQTSPDLQDEFSTHVASLGESFAQQAAAYQLRAQQQFFTNGIQDELNKSNTNIGANPTQHTLDTERKRITDFIGATVLSPEEKVAEARKAYTQMEAITYKGMYKSALTDPTQNGVGQASELIQSLSGDAGSNPSKSFEENQAALTDRVNAGTQAVVSAIGSIDLWSRIPPQVQAAIISNVDSHGGVVNPDLANAIKSGNITNVADALRSQNTSRSAIEANVADGTTPPLSAGLDSDSRYANIPYETRLTLRADAEREVTQASVEQTKAADAQQNQYINSLKLAIDQGTAGQTDLDVALQRYPNMKASDYSEMQKGLASSTNKIVLANEAVQKLSSGQVFDPSDPRDKQRLNAVIGDQGIAAVNKLDGNYMAQTVIPLVRQAQDVPSELGGTLVGMIRNTDPQKAQWALDALSQIQLASPKGFSQRFNADTESAIQLYQTGKDYYSPTDLLSMVRGGDTPEAQAQIKQARIDGKALLITGKETNKVILANNFIRNIRTVPGGWGQAIGGKTEAALPAYGPQQEALKNDFNNLFINEYAKYHDENLAIESATNLMKRDWAVTNIGGTPTLMKNPPELAGYPSIGGNYNWIDNQIRSDLQLPKGTDYQLIGDEQTRKEISTYHSNGASTGLTGPDDRQTPPSYLIYIKSPDGAHLATDANGIPRRIFFQPTQEDLAGGQHFMLQMDQIAKDHAFLDMYTKAAQHSVYTGIPIPADLVNEYKAKFGDSGPAPVSVGG